MNRSQVDEPIQEEAAHTNDTDWISFGLNRSQGDKPEERGWGNVETAHSSADSDGRHELNHQTRAENQSEAVKSFKEQKRCTDRGDGDVSSAGHQLHTGAAC